jgi:hypothetical protein
VRLARVDGLDAVAGAGIDADAGVVDSTARVAIEEITCSNGTGSTAGGIVWAGVVRAGMTGVTGVKG